MERSANQHRRAAPNLVVGQKVWLLRRHIHHVRAILQIPRNNQLYAKIEKCEFHKDSMTFVGYLVSSSGIGMDPAKVSAVRIHSLLSSFTFSLESVPHLR